VTGAACQAADGSCTGTPVDLPAASTCTIAENDFMVTGGDGYPNFASRAPRRDHGPGPRRLDLSDHADQPRDPGPGQLHDERRDTLPDADAVATGPASRVGGPQGGVTSLHLVDLMLGAP
jgi:hypothetical protein